MSNPATHNNLIKRLIFAVIFIIAAIGISFVAPKAEVAWVSAILLLTIYLFAFEIVSVDVTAVTIMVLLGLTGLIAGTEFGIQVGMAEQLIDPKHLFDGFAGNAVISIIAVMIIGAGLDKTGIMGQVANFILKIGGSTEKRIIPIISSTVGFISSFMQNVGAAALFLPVVSRISTRTGLPMSRLLMPMGFCAILGGTVTMVGSSPLILLNDLILNSNKVLPETQQMETFGLFSVTPIGIALVATGILYFVIAGRFVLPANKNEGGAGTSTLDYFKDVYGVEYGLHELPVNPGSELVNKNLMDTEREYKVRVVMICAGEEKPIGPAQDVIIESNSVLGVVAAPDALQKLEAAAGSEVRTEMQTFNDALSPNKAGIAEIVIPASSNLIGKTARDVWMRKTHGFAILSIHRNGETIREGTGVRDLPFQAGDTLVGHVAWDDLARLEQDHLNFVVITTEYPHEELRPHKLTPALIFFAIALSLVLFSDLRLSISLLVGAMGMVLSGVLTMDEAYEAVSWKTVFLLASLIPLGGAVENSGTAAWIAEQTLQLFGENPTIWLVQLAIAVLATFFTLVMSNVGATVLLVPLAVNIAIGAGADPAVFALTVAIATSNSFLIPTHQVNALIMGPGSYRVPDYMKAGGIMTVLFLTVAMIMLNLVF